jgi:hypothetical protein
MTHPLRVALLCAAGAALPLAAQPKFIVNAKADTRSAAQGLDREFRALMTAQQQPGWLGYEVPATRTASLGCEYNRGDGYYGSGTVHLEPPATAVILFRAEAGAVQRIRTFSPYCEIDASGLPVHWLSDVQPAQSIALLESFLADREHVGDSPVSAISAHSDPSADQALEKLLASSQPQSMRLRVVSSLGASRGRHGFEVLKKLISSDPDERVRERAISALSSSREPDAIDLLISIARTNADSRMRSQAVSSLNHRTSPKVLETLVAVVENDSDLNVKRRAVSSIQNLPDGQGIPTLIQLAKADKNVEVRKQAMNSLKDTRDPRAMAFFEDVLKK